MTSIIWTQSELDLFGLLELFDYSLSFGTSKDIILQREY